MPSKKEILGHWEEKFAAESLYDVISTDEDGLSAIACFSCGSPARVERAHITAINQGGSNEVENLHLLCRSCHSDSEIFSGPDYMDWFYWRLNQPGYMAARLSMCAMSWKLPVDYLKRSIL